MLPKHHIIIGFLFSAFLFYSFPQLNLFGCFIIFLSTFLIDVDHYLYYVFLKKDLSLKRAYRWFIAKHNEEKDLTRQERKKNPLTPMFFHGIEILVILYFLKYEYSHQI